MSASDYTGLILAAGLGSRLRPATDYYPKPLVPIAGVEPLYYALWSFHRLGLKTTLVNTHYKADKVEAFLAFCRERFSGMHIISSSEQPAVLGTGGAILRALKEYPELFVNKGLLLQNGDTLSNLNREPLLEDPTQNRLAVSFRPRDLEKYKPLWLDERGFWCGIGPRPRDASKVQAAHFLGLHSLGPRALADLRDLEPHPIDLFNGIYRPLAERGHVFHALPFFQNKEGSSRDFWFDMNTLELVLHAQQSLLRFLATQEESEWHQVLRHRHPHIRQTQEGCWTNVPPDSERSVRLQSPVVWIQEEGSCSLPLQRLGPSAVMWNKCLQEKLENGKLPRSIERALVIVQEEGNACSQEIISEDICVCRF